MMTINSKGVPTIIETKRLRLRAPKIEDADTIFNRYAQDVEVVKFLSWRPHSSVDETRAFLKKCIENWRHGGEFTWVIEHRIEHELLGMISLRVNRYSANAGYVLAKSNWGEGYMPEALIAIRDVVLDIPGIYRFWTFCDVENKASARVMEKAGLMKEGCLRRYFVHPNIDSVPRDCYCYAIVKD